MMKKLFMKHENLRKCHTRIAGVLMSVVLASCVCTTVQAADTNPASGSGVINGVTCSATLTKYSNHATASTDSSLVAYHYAEVTFNCQYTDDNLTVKSFSHTEKASNSASVFATSTCNGIAFWEQSASSVHKITYGSYTWEKSFNIPVKIPSI